MVPRVVSWHKTVSAWQEQLQLLYMANWRHLDCWKEALFDWTCWTESEARVILILLPYEVQSILWAARDLQREWDMQHATGGCVGPGFGRRL